MNSRRAPLTAVRSSTTRSQGLRSLVIGAKNYYDSWPETIRKVVFFRIVVKPLVFLQFLQLPWKPQSPFQSSSSACARKGQVCPPTSIRFLASVCFYLKVLGAKLDHHTRVKKDFLGLCRFRILGPLIALNEVFSFRFARLQSTPSQSVRFCPLNHCTTFTAKSAQSRLAGSVRQSA